MAITHAQQKQDKLPVNQIPTCKALAENSAPSDKGSSVSRVLERCLFQLAEISANFHVDIQLPEIPSHWKNVQLSRCRNFLQFRDALFGWFTLLENIKVDISAEIWIFVTLFLVGLVVESWPIWVSSRASARVADFSANSKKSTFLVISKCGTLISVPCFLSLVVNG